MKWLVNLIVLISAALAEPEPSVNINIQDVKSPKGQLAWVVEHHHSEVISVCLTFKNAGQTSDPADLIGRASLAISSLDEGAGEKKALELKQALLELNMQLSLTCTDDSVTVFVRFPSKNLASVLALLKVILTQPRFDADAISLIRNRLVLQLKQSLQDEGAVASNARNAFVYGNHPYARQPEEEIESLPRITAADLKTYIKDHLTQDQLQVVAVGDFNTADFLSHLDDLVQALPEKAVTTPVPDVVWQNMGEEKFVSMDIPQTQLLFIQPGIPRIDPDWIPLMLLNRIAGAGDFKSRLWDDIRETRGLVYSIHTEPTSRDHAHSFLGSAGTKTASYRDVIDIIRQHWTELAKTGTVTQEELDFAKDYFLGALVVGLDSTEAICHVLASLQYYGLPVTYIKDRAELIKNVTLEDIQRVIKRVIDPGKLTFIIVGKQK